MSQQHQWIVRHASEAPTVPCPCGSSTRILTRADGQETINLHVTQINDAKTHYHKKCTEVYYVLEGQGTMELDGTLMEVRPGSVIYIPPGTRHRGGGEFKTIIVGTPAFDEHDEYFD